MLPAESFFFSPYTSPHWLFPNQPLNMAPVVLPEDLSCLFNEATILQLSHRHSPPFQTNPWYRRAISLSSKKTLFPWPLDFDSSCILTSWDIFFNSDFSPQIQFCMSAGLQDPCAECHDIAEFPAPHRIYHLSQASSSVAITNPFPHGRLPSQPSGHHGGMRIKAKSSAEMWPLWSSLWTTGSSCFPPDF